MKRILVSALIITLSVITAKAQTSDKHEEKRHHKSELKKKFDQLNLTSEQKEQVKKFREEFHNKMKELKKNDQMSVSDLKSRKAQLHKEFRSKVESILTPEQKEKFSKMKEKRGKNISWSKGQVHNKINSSDTK